MKLSIIIPVFNEASTISRVLETLFSMNIPGVTKEYVIVNDGSTDETSSLIKKKIRNKKNARLIIHAKNQGKGASIRSGLKVASGDYVLIQDADLEYNPKDITKLLKPVQSGEAEVVYGSRLNRLPDFARDERTVQFFVHYLGNKALSLITSILFGRWITDMETGYKLFPKSALIRSRLESNRFDFEAEITAKLIKNGYTIIEIPITTNPRDYKQGKKLRTGKDGLAAFITLIKYRFSN